MPRRCIKQFLNVKNNDEKISIHQINFVLSPTDGINQDYFEIAKKHMANAIIDQMLQNQQAMVYKMDRDPEIMMVIEQTNRQMLAQACLDRATLNINKFTVQGIEQYYLTHPRFFAKHKIFKLKEILIDKVDDKGRDEAINKGVKGLFPMAV